MSAKPNIDTQMSHAILALAEARGPGKSICPSEAARHVGSATGAEWHSLMQPARRAAVALAREGRAVILRKGKPVDPDDFRGVYRITLPSSE